MSSIAPLYRQVDPQTGRQSLIVTEKTRLNEHVKITILLPLLINNRAIEEELPHWICSALAKKLNEVKASIKSLNIPAKTLDDSFFRREFKIFGPVEEEALSEYISDDTEGKPKKVANEVLGNLAD